LNFELFMPFDLTQRPLTLVEARVLGTLMEKARTVPDSYPLSLNMILIGCNQKTSREPVMELTEDDILGALDGLRSLSLVFEASGSRVTRYDHNFQRVVGVSEQHAVLLGLLMLRGPQTAAELRTNADRWYKFPDTGSVEVYLAELAPREEPPSSPGTESRPDSALQGNAVQLGRDPTKGSPLAVLLPRAPGARESRWAQLLCGPVASAKPVRADEVGLVDKSGLPGPVAGYAVAHTYAALQGRIEALEARLAEVQGSHAGLAQALKDQLGLEWPGVAH
jgi:uncharacterized protein